MSRPKHKTRLECNKLSFERFFTLWTVWHRQQSTNVKFVYQIFINFILFFSVPKRPKHLLLMSCAKLLPTDEHRPLPSISEYKTSFVCKSWFNLTLNLVVAGSSFFAYNWRCIHWQKKEAHAVKIVLFRTKQKNTKNEDLIDWVSRWLEWKKKTQIKNKYFLVIRRRRVLSSCDVVVKVNRVLIITCFNGIFQF